ncbi:MAG: hypothetical protein QOE86_2139 [Solirubrobacteraceae bacterium]|nr:hypothetical protein [Solirubrobacteraceae bacterium]
MREDWVAAQAGTVRARAREIALERAVARLAGELEEELLAAARRRSPPPPEPAGADLLWCYGVVIGDEAPQTGGVDGAAVRALPHRGLTALVSDVPDARFSPGALEQGLEDLGRLESLARAHERVLDGALATGPVVPFRLCTIYSGEDAVRAALDERREELTGALRLVAGMAEWSVKVLHRPAEVPAAAAEPVASGADYLARRVQARDQAAATDDAAYAAADAIHARLVEHAADAVVSRPQDRRLGGYEGEMVLNGAYLVADDRAAGFRALVEELAERHETDDLHFQLTGPWPAHHFTAAATG